MQSGQAATRTAAQRMVKSGWVTVNGAVAGRCALEIQDVDQVQVTQTARFVSRGGEKLDFALGEFEVEVQGLLCLDVGASTGGFTDCLLARGAARVHCVDAGREQLHPTLRQDSRVSFQEGINARHLEPSQVPFAPQIVVMDVSFISQTLILPALRHVAAPGAHFVTLVKPQFELQPAELGKNGVVRERALHLKALQRVQDCAQNLGFIGLRTVTSPLHGGDGNTEFLLGMRWLGLENSP